MYLNHRFWDNMVEDIKINKDKNYILVKFWRDGIVAEDKIEKINYMFIIITQDMDGIIHLHS